MDWNGDGTTTLNEFSWAIDIDTRKVTVNGQTCTEYDSMKDGLPMKVVCPTRN